MRAAILRAQNQPIQDLSWYPPIFGNFHWWNILTVSANSASLWKLFTCNSFSVRIVRYKQKIKRKKSKLCVKKLQLKKFYPMAKTIFHMFL